MSFLLLSIYHWVLWPYLTILCLLSVFVILEFPYPAHLFPAWMALLVMPVGSCKNKQGDNCCSVPPAAALCSGKEVTTVAVRVQLATASLHYCVEYCKENLLEDAVGQIILL